MSDDNRKQSRTLFISDLHLDSDTPAITHTFLDFLERQATGARALYILGDLFEAWVGDDDHGELSDNVADALARLADGGTDVFLMHGNRDFLIGRDYAARCRATLLEDPTVTDCHGQRIALMHGDSLCTRDNEYMAFRQQVRSPEWQDVFLSKSLVERYMIAQQAREQSREANTHKTSDIMDVTYSEVIDTLHELDVTVLVHGHTHRPAVHTITLEDPVHSKDTAVRIVLGDWHNKGWVLEFTDEGYELRNFPLLKA
ncbi:MAG: UDP-2,3-diacylglucosamine diphosphatase [Pseudohongiellaceae bacterium]